MSELANEQDAIERAHEMFRPDGTLTDDHISDYGKAAYFLSDDGRFIPALDEVSSIVWQAYSKRVQRFSTLNALVRNRFTTALNEYAGMNGFQPDHMLLTNGVTDGIYVDWVKQGFLFKDMMDAKHGEYSHTFQWLAILRQSFKTPGWLKRGAAELYKSVYNVKRKGSKDIEQPVSNNRQNERTLDPVKDEVGVWNWVADCFPYAPNARKSIYSATCRSPQKVTEYLLNRTDDTHFLGTYLKHRYRTKNFFKSGEEAYRNVSGAASKSRAAENVPGNPGWQRVVDNAYARVHNPGDWFESMSKSNKERMKEVTFHHIPGVFVQPANA